MTIEITTLIVSSLTLIVTLVSAVLTYKLEKQKKRMKQLEKKYSIVLDNLEANYESEEYYAKLLNKTRPILQREINDYLKGKDLSIDRNYYSPSFIKKERNYLK